MRTNFWIFLFISFLSFGFTNSALAATETAAQDKVDGQIIKDVMVIDKSEISAADLALKKSTDNTIKDYAKWLKKEHTTNLNDYMNLSKKTKIEPQDSNNSKDLVAHGEEVEKQLNTLNGQDFDKKYINDMVKDHKAALLLIDTDLLKNVTNPEVKKQVEKTRTHVDAHLQKAMKIESDMKAKA